MPQPIRFTKQGFEKLKEEYENLKNQRPAVVEDVKKAREMGDLSENGYYKASKAKLGFIDSRLMRLKFTMKSAIIVADAVGDTIQIGKTVTLSHEDKKNTYAIVGDMEANPGEGKISLLSPLGRALDGKKVGDHAAIQTPKKVITYKIIAIT